MFHLGEFHDKQADIDSSEEPVNALHALISLFLLQLVPPSPLNKKVSVKITNFLFKKMIIINALLTTVSFGF